MQSSAAGSCKNGVGHPAEHMQGLDSHANENYNAYGPKGTVAGVLRAAREDSGTAVDVDAIRPAEAAQPWLQQNSECDFEVLSDAPNHPWNHWFLALAYH